MFVASILSFDQLFDFKDPLNFSDPLTHLAHGFHITNSDRRAPTTRAQGAPTTRAQARASMNLVRYEFGGLRQACWHEHET